MRRPLSGQRMSIKLQKESEKYLIGSIKRFFAESMDDDIGDLKASLVLDFFVSEMGPSIYNQAIADAQTYFQVAASPSAGEFLRPLDKGSHISLGPQQRAIAATLAAARAAGARGRGEMRRTGPTSPWR